MGCFLAAMVLQQNAVLQGLVPALDLALGLRVVRGAADMGHALTLEPGGEVGGDIGRAVVAEQAGPVQNRCSIAARGFQGELQRARAGSSRWSSQ